MHKGGRPIGKEKESKGSSQKRKRDDEEDEDEDEEAQKGSKGSGSRKEPKKFKRAFGFFVKAKRADAEARIGDPSVRHIPEPLPVILTLPTVQPSPPI